MDIVTVGPDDPLVGAVVALLNEGARLDSPWRPPTTERGLRAMLRHGWDGEAPPWFACLVDGQIVATGGVFASTYDNLNAAWLEVQVHPDSRRRGFGTALVTHLESSAAGDGRTVLGIDGWEAPGVSSFAAAHGYELKQHSVCRRLTVTPDLPARLAPLHDEALAKAGDYELIRLAGPLPDDWLAPMGQLVAAINDAPLDDLVLEDEVFPAERLKGYDQGQLARGHRLYRVIARHRPTGELAGHTVVAVEQDRPHLGDQHDTSVIAAHRGHRLGMLLKTEMMRWLGEAEPKLEQVDTFNAESNDHMIGVNDAMGYQPVGRAVIFQKGADDTN
ncbi:MAG: GNAT family N-acetyltransferase [Candidatus Phosphoribacter sp.]